MSKFDIISKKGWRAGKKPVERVEIDWAHPLAKGLLSFISPGHGELVTGQPLVYSSANLTPTMAGMASSASNLGYVEGNVVDVQNTTMTIAAHLPAWDSNTQTYSYVCGIVNGTNYVALAAPQAGIKPIFYYHDSGNTAGTDDLVDGKEYILIGRHTGTERQLWVNGELKTSDSDTLSAVPIDNFVINNISNGSENFESLSPVAFGAIWNRALSDTECREFTRNPYQILKPAANKPFFLKTYDAATVYDPTEVVGGDATGNITATTDDVTAALTGSATTPVTGDIASTIDNATGALTGKFVSTGDISATLETITGALTGINVNVGDIAASTEAVSGSLSGTFISTGSISVTTEDIVSALVGSTTTPTTGDISASTEEITASLTGSTTVPNTGDIAANTEAVTGAITGQIAHTGNIVALVDTVTADLSGSVTAGITGDISASTEAVTGSLVGTGYADSFGDISAILADIESSIVGNNMALMVSPARPSRRQIYPTRAKTEYPEFSAEEYPKR